MKYEISQNGYMNYEMIDPIAMVKRDTIQHHNSENMSKFLL